MAWCLLGERLLGVCLVRGSFPGRIQAYDGGGPQVGPLVDKSPQGKIRPTTESTGVDPVVGLIFEHPRGNDFEIVTPRVLKTGPAPGGSRVGPVVGPISVHPRGNDFEIVTPSVLRTGSTPGGSRVGPVVDPISSTPGVTNSNSLPLGCWESDRATPLSPGKVRWGTEVASFLNDRGTPVI